MFYASLTSDRLQHLLTPPAIDNIRFPNDGLNVLGVFDTVFDGTPQLSWRDDSAASVEHRALKNVAVRTLNLLELPTCDRACRLLEHAEIADFAFVGAMLRPWFGEVCVSALPRPGKWRTILKEELVDMLYVVESGSRMEGLAIDAVIQGRAHAVMSIRL